MKSTILIFALVASAANAQQAGELYDPGPAVAFNSAGVTTSYKDDAGDTRTLELFVRRPAGISGALPTVVWSHSAEVSGDVKTLMALWAEATARAGYLTVVVSHPVRTMADAQRQCDAIRADEEACYRIRLVNWDWPRDLRAVLDFLEKQPEVDSKRIAVAGHQDGGSAAVSLAGAMRLLRSLDRKKADTFTDPRPAAFVSLSPQGPGLEGFADTDWFQDNHSWMNIKRPVFQATGGGDNTCYFGGSCRSGDTATRRQIPFALMPDGGKHLLFVNSAKISHELIGSLNTDSCVAAGIEPALCTSFADWLRTSTIAFLDAYVKGRPAAQAWLASGGLSAVSKGMATIESK